MTYQDPNDPNRPPVYTETVVTTQPGVTETIETVVVRESNTGWWIAGILAGVVLLAVLWILFARGNQTAPADDALLQAQADAAVAQAQADQALINSQTAGAQASVDIARSDAARSQAEATRAQAEARAAEARAAEPVIIEREVPVPTGPAVVTTTTPQN